MKISVVIITYNRIEELRKTLAGIAAQTLRPHEIILINNGSTCSYDVLLTDSRFSELPIRYSEIMRTSIAAARNAGIALAHGDYIAFTDDDCIPDPGWLSCISEPFMQNPQVAQTGGAIVQAASTPSIVEQYGQDTFLDLLSRYAPGILPQKARYPFAFFFATANTAVRASALRAIGGFDEHCTTGEDVDLSARLIQAGHLLYYAPNAIVAHTYRKSFLALLRQMAGYGAGHAYLFFKHSAEPRCIMRFGYYKSQDGTFIPKHASHPALISGFINRDGRAAFLFYTLIRPLFLCGLLYFLLGALWAICITGTLLFIDERGRFQHEYTQLCKKGILYYSISLTSEIIMSATAFLRGIRLGFLFID